MPNEADKTVKFSISMPQSIADNLDASRGAESRSSYIARKIQDTHFPDPKAPDPLLKLCFTYADHETTDHIEDGIQRLNINQPHLIAHLLRELGKALHRTQDDEDWHGLWIAPPHIVPYQDQYDLAVAEHKSRYSLKANTPNGKAS